MAILRKLIFPTIFLAFQFGINPSVLKAATLSCPERLNRIALQSITEGRDCEDCEKNLIKAIKTGPDVTTVMANWISSEALPIQNFNGMQISANKAGVEILSNLSSQMAFSNSPSGSRLLTTFVFRGNKKQLLKFFQNISEQPQGLANFEVLDAYRNPVPVEVATINSALPEDAEGILKSSIQEAQSKVVFLNDSETRSFLALVSEGTFRDLNLLSDRNKKVASIGTTRLAKTWTRNFLGVRKGLRFIRVESNSDPDQKAYLINLSDLSQLETERAILKSQLGGTVTVEGESNDGENVLAITTYDFIRRRGIVFAKNKFTLSLEGPAFVISAYDVPSFVVFYPQYLNRASEAEILSTYKSLGQISPDEKVPRSIINFISTYKFGQTKPNAYLDFSLSDLKGNEGSKLLKKSIKNKKPIIATQLRSEGNDDAMILIPVLRK